MGRRGGGGRRGAGGAGATPRGSEGRGGAARTAGGTVGGERSPFESPALPPTFLLSLRSTFCVFFCCFLIQDPQKLWYKKLRVKNYSKKYFGKTSILENEFLVKFGIQPPLKTFFLSCV